MKRSEAVNIIHDKLTDILLDCCQFPLLKEVSLGDAEGLLEKLEQAGMLPPTTKLEHLNVSDNAWEKE